MADRDDHTVSAAMTLRALYARCTDISGIVVGGDAPSVAAELVLTTLRQPSEVVPSTSTWIRPNQLSGYALPIPRPKSAAPTKGLRSEASGASLGAASSSVGPPLLSMSNSSGSSEAARTHASTTTGVIGSSSRSNTTSSSTCTRMTNSYSGSGSAADGGASSSMLPAVPAVNGPHVRGAVSRSPAAEPSSGGGVTVAAPAAAAASLPYSIRVPMRPSSARSLLWSRGGGAGTSPVAMTVAAAAAPPPSVDDRSCALPTTRDLPASAVTNETGQNTAIVHNSTPAPSSVGPSSVRPSERSDSASSKATNREDAVPTNTFLGPPPLSRPHLTSRDAMIEITTTAPSVADSPRSRRSTTSTASTAEPESQAPSRPVQIVDAGAHATAEGTSSLLAQPAAASAGASKSPSSSSSAGGWMPIGGEPVYSDTTAATPRAPLPPSHVQQYLDDVESVSPMAIPDPMCTSVDIPTMAGSTLSKLSDGTSTSHVTLVGMEAAVTSMNFPSSTDDAIIAGTTLAIPEFADTHHDEMEGLPVSSEYLWVLFRAYVRIRCFARRWKAKHQTDSDAQRKQQSGAGADAELFEQLDSNDWRIVYKVEWCERGGAVTHRGVGESGESGVDHGSPFGKHSGASPLGNPRSISATATPTLRSNHPRHGNIAVGGSSTCAPVVDFCSPTKLTQHHYEAGFLHLSTSHVYLSSALSTHSISVRYTDVLQVQPKRRGFEIFVRATDAESPEEGDSDSDSETATSSGVDMRASTLLSDVGGGGSGGGSANVLRATPSGYFPLQRPSTHSTSSRSSGSPTTTLANAADAKSKASSKGPRLSIHCRDPSQVMMSLLELQAAFLRSYSFGLSERLTQKATTRTLHIVHFNDVYHLPPFKPANARGVVGGAARFHTVLARLREQTNPLVLFSGDFMGPSLMSVITKGKQMVDALNFLGVHYGCFGNHEFDFGLRTLKEVIHGYTQGKHIYTGSQTVWVMSNMVESDNTPLGGAKQYALCTWNGIRIGILGLCENWLPQCANLHHSEATYLDIFERGEVLARTLKEEDRVDLVFALTHNRNNVDRELAVRCPSIDYIFGGHDHKFKSEPKFRFIKSGQEFEYLTSMEVTLTPGKKPKYRIDCVPITFDVKESEYMRGLIHRYDAKMAEKLGRTIGKSEVDLDSTEETVRFKEGHLTNFILDVIQSAMDTELAFLGAAAIAGKEVKPAGNVTLGDVFGWFPNETKIMTMRLRGSTIKKTLDVMVRELPAEAPSFPHPSVQLSFTINMLRKPPVCEDICVNGAPLDMDRSYLCAVEDFVGIGRAKYKHVAAEGEVVVGEEDAVQVVSMVRDFFLKGSAAQIDAKEAAALKNVNKVVSSATHIGVDMDMAKSQRFVRSLICELLHCNRSAIFLVDNATNQIHFIPDNMDKEIRMPKDKGLAGYCATNCEMLNIEDAYEDARFNRAIDIQTGYRTKTVLCVPVLLDGCTCSAVVQAVNKDNDALFDEIDEITLRVLGEQVSFQLRYQSIFQLSRADLEFSSAWVLDILRTMTADVSLDLISCLKTLAQHACNAFRCDAAKLLRIDTAEWTASYLEEGLDDESIVVTSEISRNSFVWELTQSLEIKAMRDASRLVILKQNDNLVCRYILGVPLLSFTSELVGVLLLFDKPRGFTDEDQVIARHFGKLTAVFMENALRLSRIMSASAETTLPCVPPRPLGRIRVKGGWATARNMFREAKNIRRLAKERGLPCPSFQQLLYAAAAAAAGGGSSSSSSQAGMATSLRGRSATAHDVAAATAAAASSSSAGTGAAADQVASLPSFSSPAASAANDAADLLTSALGLNVTSSSLLPNGAGRNQRSSRLTSKLWSAVLKSTANSTSSSSFSAPSTGPPLPPAVGAFTPMTLQLREPTPRNSPRPSTSLVDAAHDSPSASESLPHDQSATATMVDCRVAADAFVAAVDPRTVADTSSSDNLDLRSVPSQTAASSEDCQEVTLPIPTTPPALVPVAPDTGGEAATAAGPERCPPFDTNPLSPPYEEERGERRR